MGTWNVLYGMCIASMPHILHINKIQKTTKMPYSPAHETLHGSVLIFQGQNFHKLSPVNWRPPPCPTYLQHRVRLQQTVLHPVHLPHMPTALGQVLQYVLGGLCGDKGGTQLWTQYSGTPLFQTPELRAPLYWGYLVQSQMYFLGIN
jgi:hypothetical protein